MRDSTRLRSVTRLLIGACVLTVSAVVTSSVAADRLGDVRSGGDRWWGVLVFIAFAASLVVLLLPGTVNTVAAGLLYGPVLGSVVALMASSLGATVAFHLAWHFGRGSIESILGQRTRSIDDRLAGASWRGVLLLRLVPLVPFNALNYAAGLSGVTAPAYIVGTVLGIVPGTIAFAAAGSSAHDPTSPLFAAALAFVVSLSLVTVFVGRRGARVRDEPFDRAPC
jgi:uncharacterized membrane protein YdjX (TVP38/TMEM64 family)